MQDCMPVEVSVHTCTFDSIVIDAVVVHLTNQRHSVYSQCFTLEEYNGHFFHILSHISKNLQVVDTSYISK